MSRVPAWFPRVRIRAGDMGPVRKLLESLDLHTVCEGALCPNRPECYAQRHVTVLILGDACTRRCRFCAVDDGATAPPDPGEPARVAEAARRLGMRHVVVTSVTRDDLPDGGAAHYAAVARALRALPAPPTAEALVPDFRGDTAGAEVVARAPYDVLAHNLETVPRLYPEVRPGADFARSLEVLEALGRWGHGKRTKSSLMLGLGETLEEVRAALRDLRSVGVELLALGQYLRPTPRQVPVVRFWSPEEFDALAEEARALGFAHVAAGPLVRSSYRAGEAVVSIAPLERA